MKRIVDKLFMVKLSSKGQIVIPKYIREALELNEGDELILVPTEEGILIKTSTKEAGKLRGLLKRLEVNVDECETILMEAKRSLTKITQ